MSTVCGIYRIRHRESGKVYVGQSRDILRRWSEHRGDRSGLYPIGKALQKYGKDAFDFEIIETCEAEELDKLEIQHIRRENSLSPGGYNLTTGGGQPDSVCEETREKLSRKQVEFYRNPENRQAQSEANRVAWSDPERRRVNSERAKKQWEDPEKRQRIIEGSRREEVRKAKSEGTKALWKRPEHRERMLKILEENRRKRV